MVFLLNAARVIKRNYERKPNIFDTTVTIPRLFELICELQSHAFRLIRFHDRGQLLFEQIAIRGMGNNCTDAFNANNVDSRDPFEFI